MCAYVWNLLKVGGSWHASSCVEEVEEDVELERLSEDDGGVIVQVVLEFKTERSWVEANFRTFGPCWVWKESVFIGVAWVFGGSVLLSGENAGTEEAQADKQLGRAFRWPIRESAWAGSFTGGLTEAHLDVSSNTETPWGSTPLVGGLLTKGRRWKSRFVAALVAEIWRGWAFAETFRFMFQYNEWLSSSDNSCDIYIYIIFKLKVDAADAHGLANWCGKNPGCLEISPQQEAKCLNILDRCDVLHVQ